MSWRALLSSLGVLLASAPALAYRPFDGTDAAVAAPGEVETELGPAGYLRQGAERTLIAPALRLNYGLAPRWEAVLEGEADHSLSGASGSRLVGAGAFLKTVLREGALQEQPGPSIATEFGALLPGVNGDRGAGGSVGAIVSEQWRSLTLHLNAVGVLTRRQHGDLFLGGILEGPRDWPVRPVAELFHEREWGGVATSSGLIGAIWQLSEGLSVDAGLRGARVGGRSLGEIRAGLSFALPLW